jgi:hypothetical protein
MKALKSARTLAASLGVLAGVAIAASPAMAFDKVDWNWTVHKYQKEFVDVDVDIDIDATGLVQIEKLQIFLGNSRANAEVYGVKNDAAHEYVKVPVQVKVCEKTYRGEHCEWKTEYKYEPLALTVAQLPEVKNAASAFGNLQVITADVPIFLHDGQFVANVKGDYYGDDSDIDAATAIFGLGLALAGVGGNTHTDLAKVFTWGAVTGVLDKADIKAEANVGYIKNATVDNSAFAAANLIQVSLESDNVGGPTTCTGQGYHKTCVTPPSDHLVQADITQFAFANVTANAKVHGVEIDGYNLDGIDRAIVNNVATAIGNAVIVNVGKVPVPETPTGGGS